MNGLFEAGDLLPVIHRTYELADLREAFRYYCTGDHEGKIVVTMA